LAPVNLAQQSFEFLPAQTPDRIYPGLRVEPSSVGPALVPPRRGSNQCIKKDCSGEYSAEDLHEWEKQERPIYEAGWRSRMGPQWRDDFTQ
jgi:hypothetical protein